MRSSVMALVQILMIVSVLVLVAACKSDKEDKQENLSSADALKKMDEENQRNRANQTIPNQAPVVTILSPATGSTVSSSPVSVSWTASDSNNDKLMMEVAYRPIIPNQAAGEFVTAMAPTTPDPKSFSFDLSALAKGDYELRVKAMDGSLSGLAFSRIKYQ